MTLHGGAKDWREKAERFNDQINEPERERILGDIDDLSRDDDRLKTEIDKYRQEVELYDRRYVLRATLTSAFQHGGALSKESQWTLAGSLSFDQHEDGPADLFIAHSPTRGTIVVLAVVQRQNATETYQRVQNLCEHVSEQIDSISQEYTVSIDEDNIQGAVAISKLGPSQLASEFDGDTNDWPVSVWELVSGDAETITLVEDFQDVDWAGHSPTGDLGTVLSQGVELADTEHLGIDLFYDSHHQRIYRYLPTHLDRHHEEDGDKKRFHFSNEELVQFLKGRQGSINRQDASTRADNLIDWWEYVDAIAPVSEPDGYDDDDDEVYTLGISGMLSSTQIDVMVEDYEEEVAKALLKRSKQSAYLD